MVADQCLGGFERKKEGVGRGSEDQLWLVTHAWQGKPTGRARPETGLSFRNGLFAAYLI